MIFSIEDYVAPEEAALALSKAKSAEARKKTKYVISAINCLSRFRGWNSEEDKDKVFDALRNRRLYFSTALGYNDPYDTLMYINNEKFIGSIIASLNSMPNYIEKLKNKSPIFGKWAEEMCTPKNPSYEKFIVSFLEEIDTDVQDLKRKIHDNIKGICFSPNHLSILMWSHYANSHRGLSLLYDKRDLINAPCFDKDNRELKSKFLLKPIQYKEKRVDATEYVNAYLLNKHRLKSVTGNLLPEINYPPHRQDILEEIVLTKDCSWSYEQEVRLIPRVLNFEQESKICYLEIVPKAIVFGAKMDKKDKHVIADLSKSIGKILLYEAVLNENQPDYNVLIQEYSKDK